MKVLKGITKAIDMVNKWVGTVSAYSVLILVVVVAYEVLSRKVFNSPTLWAFETITMCYGFLFMMVSGFGLFKGSLVCVDVLSSGLSDRSQHVLSVVTYVIFFFPFITMILPYAWNFFYNSFLIREASWSQWAPPVYPIKFVIPVALVLLWLQGISEFLKSIIWLIENKDVPTVKKIKEPGKKKKTQALDEKGGTA